MATERKCGRAHAGPCAEEIETDILMRIRDVMASKVQHQSDGGVLIGTPSDWAEALLVIDDLLAKESRQAYTENVREALTDSMNQDWRC